MSEIGIAQTQRTSQLQTQIMSQKQILAMKLIGMGSQELRDEIIRQAEENPALEIVRDPLAEGATAVRRKTTSPQTVRTGGTSVSGQAEADEFQKMLESSPDERETLQEHLLHQLNMLPLPEKQHGLCEKIIGGLDENGHYLLAPESFLDRTDDEASAFLDSCISIIRSFDPAGICCKDVSESLEIQAQQNGDASALTLFILHGHLELIVPPSAEKARKKIAACIASQNTLAFQEKHIPLSQKDISLKHIEESIKYIQSLDPYPARNFGVRQTAHFIRPDVYITREKGILEKENKDIGFVIDTEQTYFKITGADDILPKVKIADDFSADSKKIAANDKEEKHFIISQQKAAQNFIDTIDFRQQAIIRACSFLVSCQKEFFRNGPGNLKPLTQRQLAELLGIHESSVSRIADSKFIRCSWGTFPVKYFFTNAVQKKPSPDAEQQQNKAEIDAFSSDTIRHEIQRILNAQQPDEKRLSDQKIASILAEKGISIARRTVAKYRAQLNIESSYNR